MVDRRNGARAVIRDTRFPLFGPFADLVKEMKPKLGEEDLAQ
jgi:hypothetical protein